MRLNAIVWGSLVALLSWSFFAETNSVIAADEDKPVKHARIGLNEYQNFLVGWDVAAQPQRFALIRSAAEYEQLFQPAAVNGSRGPFAPPEKAYATEQILLVARQMPAPQKPESVFEVESLEEQGDQLTLKYRYREPGAASYEVRNYLALRIPAKKYAKVVFIENGKEAGELNLADGQWAKPAPEAK